MVFGSYQNPSKHHLRSVISSLPVQLSFYWAFGIYTGGNCVAGNTVICHLFIYYSEGRCVCMCVQVYLLFHLLCWTFQ